MKLHKYKTSILGLQAIYTHKNLGIKLHCTLRQAQQNDSE